MLIGLAAGALFLWLAAWSVDWHGVGRALAAARIEMLAPIALLLTAHYFFKALRWRVLLADSAAISPAFAMRLTMIGFFMNNIFPARIGEVARPYLLSVNTPGASFPFALATVVGDKLFDLLLNILTLLALSFLLSVPTHVRIGLLVLVAAGFGLIGASLTAALIERRGAAGLEKGLAARILALFGRHREGARNALLGFARGLATVSSARRAAAALAYSLLAFGCLGFAVCLMLSMMNLDPSLLTAVAVIGLGGIGFILPAPPTNAGTFHFFASAALSVTMAVGADEAFSFALASHASQVVVVTALGAVSLIGLDWRRISRPLDEERKPEELAPR